jgi:hypothetical protein
LSSGAKRVDGMIQVGGLHEDVIHIKGGDGKDADVGLGERPCHQFEHTGLGELQRSFDLEGMPVVVADNVSGDGVIGGNDAELVRRAGNRVKNTAVRPLGESLQMERRSGSNEMLSLCIAFYARLSGRGLVVHHYYRFFVIITSSSCRS